MSNLVPRKYQEELFIAARERNVVAAMETGSGKTFIAVLLIRWIAMHLDKSEGKVIVFLVPKVPLVNQQVDFIRSQVPLTVKGYFGQLGVDLWDRTRWEREFAEADILVMTAQIYKDLLAHSHWSIEKTSLIIFDEAHHCAKNHVYNQIMRDHYFFTLSSQRPKIFGMTASPIWTPKNSSKALQDLERNLDVQVLAVKEHVAELAVYAPRPVEHVLEYPSPPSMYRGYPQPTLWDELDASGLLPIDSERITELENRYLVTLEALGPCGADRYLLTEIERDLFTRERERAKLNPSYQATTVEDDDYSVLAQMGRVRKTLAARPYLQPSAQEIPPDWLSPKLASLVTTLMSHKSDSFQAIIFVEQRQVAHTLSWMLNGIPGIKEWIQSAPLIGHGVHRGFGVGIYEDTRGMGFKHQQEVVRDFREMKYNVLVATSVAEEGLDFQACHLIVIFDLFKTITSYVQGRGRARRADSVYVVMLETGKTADRERYEEFRDREPELQKMYQQTLRLPVQDDDDDDDEIDLHNRERYVVESTGALLTYDHSISLLNNFCSLIRRDNYTTGLQPIYTVADAFIVEVRLPSALPLPRDKLVYSGLHCRAKKEAKRSAAFNAVRTLHRDFQVFDDFLLPARAEKAPDAEDADGNAPGDVGGIPDMMDVLVRDCWGDPQRTDQDLYLHRITADGRDEDMAIIGAFQFLETEYDMEIAGRKCHVHISKGTKMIWPSEEERASQVDLLVRFTLRGIAHAISTSRIEHPPACFYVPLVSNDSEPDYIAMEKILNEGFSSDWSLTTSDFNGLVLLPIGDSSETYLFRGFSDLQVRDVTKFPRRLQKALERGYLKISPDGPIIQAQKLNRNYSKKYRPTIGQQPIAPDNPCLSLPRSLCKLTPFPSALALKYHLFPPITRYLTDMHRVNAVQKHLSLAPINFDLCVEALTLPCSSAGFSNQRLETLGDSVLKICTTIYIFNKFRYRHEGQLSMIRAQSVSNRSLLGKANRLSLEQFLISEMSNVRKPYGPVVQGVQYINGAPFVERRFPRRSLQDCMEALLGASYLSGGIQSALETGTALSLCFGGKLPWSRRYKIEVPPSGHTPLLFTQLEEDLGYHFKYPQLLKEAVTHPSFQEGDTPSYQRLEFLGDAVIDMVVIDYLYHKFPLATPGQLSWMRSRAVCNPALASTSLKILQLHKYLFADSMYLAKALNESLPPLLDLPESEIISSAWKMDPPKVASDLLESIAGAILLDSDYNFKVTADVILRLMGNVLDTLKPSLPLDPTSHLMIWLARQGCVKISFRKSQSNLNSLRRDMAVLVVHGVEIGQPCLAENAPSARARASEQARKFLMDEDSEFSLNRLCDCERNQNSRIRLDTIEKPTPDEVNLETEEGFNREAWIHVRDVGEPLDEKKAGSDDEGPNVDNTARESSQTDDIDKDNQVELGGVA